MIIGSGGTMDVTVTIPDQTTHSLELFDDGNHGDGAPGDGVFGGFFSETSLGGRYVVDGHCEIALGTETVERSGMNMFVVDSDPATLVAVSAERPVDDNNNGKYERLEFDIDILIDEPGSYQVRAVLEDFEQEQIAEDHVLFEIQAGTPTYRTETLQFDSGTLVAHGVHGPWTLARIELFDNTQVLLVDTLDDWPTAAYDLSQFEPPPDPVLIQVLPDYGPVYGGNEIIIQGGYLDHVTAITLGGTPVRGFEILSDLSIRVTVPRAPGLAAGSVDLELTTAWTTATFPDAYTYVGGLETRTPGGSIGPISVQRIPPP